MKRTQLVTAVAIAPLLMALAGVGHAQTSITSSTSTPLTTATASSGAPGNIDVASGGSVNATTSGVDVTLNSSNAVTNEGQIGFSNVNNAVGVLVLGGNTGSLTSTGSISLTESYTASADSNNDGLLTGAFAQGFGRIGIEVAGPGTFTGGITTTGTITVDGESTAAAPSAGISIQAPITGDLLMQTVTPSTTAGALATVADGTITVLGDNIVGLQVTSTGGVGGNVKIVSVNATGANAKAVDIEGAVGGGINISGTVTATGYRSTTRPTNTTLSNLYTAQELQQGGPAVVIGGSVGGGLLISAPPLVQSATNTDLDGNGVPDSLQGSGSISEFGAAPALIIGSATAGNNITLGPVTVSSAAGSTGYGFVLQGSVTADGVYDQLLTPNLPAPVSATAIQLGQAGGGTVDIQGGIHIDGGPTHDVVGNILAEAYQADATAIHILSGVTTPTIVNDGSITATSAQQNTNTTGAGVAAANVNAILIEAGANVGSIVNNAGILANLTGNGGVGATQTGADDGHHGGVGAIIDNSGSLTSITNTGTITAQLTQTLDTSIMPGTVTAIDISHGTAPQTITQSQSSTYANTAAYNTASSYVVGNLVTYNGAIYEAVTSVSTAYDPVDYPSLWRQVGAVSPSISGSIYFGSGGSTLNVTAGTIYGATIDLGSGVNTVNVNGSGVVVSGALLDEGGHLTLNVLNGTLSDLNSGVVHADSVNVGATGVLLVSADPLHNTNTLFVTSGASTFAQGAEIGVTLKSVQSALSQTYTILETAPGGTLSAGTFATGLLSNAPWLYYANASYVPATTAGAPSEIQLTVQQKTAAQLGFNKAEAGALDAVIAALSKDSNISSAILSQTTAAGLKSTYDQLLPNQGQGLFDALDAAARSIAGMTSTTPDAGTRVGGSSLWLQEVNERIDRTGVDSQGSHSSLLGLVAGVEHAGAAGGAVGATLSYINASEVDNAQAVGGHVIGSMVEAGLYYRRAIGPLTMAARGGVGYAWFSENRLFVGDGAYEDAHSNWGAYFYDAHASAAFEQRFGRFYARPEIDADYLGLNEDAHQETGGSDGFNLDVARRDSNRLSGTAQMTFGRQWGTTSWLRAELRGGYREVFSGQVGDTIASFAGGDPFSLSPDSDKGGWVTAGFSLKAGTPYSYVALEGDAEFRAGERRYDLRIAGRSMF